MIRLTGQPNNVCLDYGTLTRKATGRLPRRGGTALPSCQRILYSSKPRSGFQKDEEGRGAGVLDPASNPSSVSPAVGLSESQMPHLYNEQEKNLPGRVGVDYVVHRRS